uniref:pyruvate kinase n=1 Tax=Oncorhynchus tshawytscha TaxID=74940 RepID=A0AAZ3PY84_ONCTS
LGSRFNPRYSDVMPLPDSFIQKQQLDASMADTFLEHLCLLDIDQEPITARNTSIICTIGPASRSIPKLQEMVKAGMNIARLNFSHGSHEYHGETIKNIREAVETITTDPLYYRPVAIALDTKGPEIRTGLVRGTAEQEVELERGASVRVVTGEGDRDSTDGNVIWVDYPSLPQEQWVNCLVRGQNDRFLPCQLRDSILQPSGYKSNALTTRLPASPS